jgi:uncharacterized protein with NRDE domain
MPRSRGSVVADFLASDMEPKEYFSHVSKVDQDIGGYNAICGNIHTGALWSHSNRGGQGSNELGAGLHAVSNGAIPDLWPKMQKGVDRLPRVLQKVNASGASLHMPEMLQRRYPRHILSTVARNSVHVPAKVLFSGFRGELIWLQPQVPRGTIYFKLCKTRRNAQKPMCHRRECPSSQRLPSAACLSPRSTMLCVSRKTVTCACQPPTSHRMVTLQQRDARDATTQGKDYGTRSQSLILITREGHVEWVERWMQSDESWITESFSFNLEIATKDIDRHEL